MRRLSPKIVAATKLFLNILLLSALCGGSLYYLYSNDLKNRETLFRGDERARVNLIAQTITSDLRLLTYNLLLLTSHQEIRRYLEEPDAEMLQDIQSAFINFSKLSKSYDQVRLLNNEGREVVRVNMKNGEPYLVPEDELQNKADRYYFRESIRMPRSMVYISPLDLNMEHGRIEEPFKPMLRLGAAVYAHDGNALGVVVLNYQAQTMLDDIYNHSGAAADRTYLLNNEGYWLLSPKKEDEWSFMFSKLNEHSFASQSPELWAIIANSESGQFEASEGIYTFATITAAESDGSRFGVAGGRSWRLLSIAPESLLVASTAAISRNYIYIFLGTVAIIVLMALLRARSNILRVQAQRDREQAQTEAEAANQAKSTFLAHMSHEIRTPMNAVIGLTHLVKHTRLTPRQKDYLDKIEMSAQNLLGIINDILDFSKIEAGQMDVERSNFSLDDVLTNVANVLALQAEQKELEFVLMVDSSVPNDLIGDSMRLGQVLINLAANAIKFTRSGEVVISVEEEKEEDGVTHLKFCVRDTGMGMTRRQLAQLFTPFSQGDSSISRRFGGTGLGLAICRKLTSLMGGDMEVSSSPGQGSTFSFTLPFQLQDKHDGLHLLPPIDVRRAKLLVVEPSSLSRRTLSAILESFTLRVTAVTNAQAALEALETASRQDPFRMVLISHKLPDSDGINLGTKICRLKTLAAQPYMLLITPPGREEELQRTASPYFDGFLYKPFSRSMLFDVIIDTMLDEHYSGAAEKTQHDTDTMVRKASVLVVEDNEINRQVAREMLQAMVSNVVMAKDGYEALSMVQRDSFDLIFMDIQMPGMDGFRTTERIREALVARHVPIIAMTAHALAGDREKSLEAGMDGHLTKPIDPQELRNALDQWLPEAEMVAVQLAFEDDADDALGPEGVPGVDLETAFARLGGNRQKLLSLLDHLIVNVGEALDTFATLVKASPARAEEYAASLAPDTEASRQDRDSGESTAPDSQPSEEDAAITAHTIKGAAANLGANDISKAAAEIELAITDGSLNEGHLKPLREALANLKNALSNSEAYRESAPPDASGTEQGQLRKQDERTEYGRPEQDSQGPTASSNPNPQSIQPGQDEEYSTRDEEQAKTPDNGSYSFDILAYLIQTRDAKAHGHLQAGAQVYAANSPEAFSKMSEALGVFDFARAERHLDELAGTDKSETNQA